MTGLKPCNGTVSCSAGNNGETERERDDDLRWGWGSFKPQWLQFFNSSLGLLAVFSSCSFVYGESRAKSAFLFSLLFLLKWMVLLRVFSSIDNSRRASRVFLRVLRFSSLRKINT